MYTMTARDVESARRSLNATMTRHGCSWRFVTAHRKGHYVYGLVEPGREDEPQDYHALPEANTLGRSAASAMAALFCMQDMAHLMAREATQDD
jgi:hypothetical protein